MWNNEGLKLRRQSEHEVLNLLVLAHVRVYTINQTLFDEGIIQNLLASLLFTSLQCVTEHHLLLSTYKHLHHLAFQLLPISQYFFKLRSGFIKFFLLLIRHRYTAT